MTDIIDVSSSIIQPAELNCLAGEGADVHPGLLGGMETVQ